MDQEEYEATKKVALRKLKRRVLFLSISYLLLSFVIIILGAVVNGRYPQATGMNKTILGVRVRTLYYILSIALFLSSCVGLNFFGKWRKMKRDGFRLLWNARLFHFLGCLTWLASIWLGIGLLSSMRGIQVNGLTSNAITFIRVVSIICIFALVFIPPWILRTVYRKTSTADEMFGAEFMSQYEYDARETQRGTTNTNIHAAMEEAIAATASAPPYEGDAAAYVDVSIPYAQSVFALDPEFSISPREFRAEWQARPSSGSFSCNFNNAPTLAQVQMHLTSNGFVIVGSKKDRDVLEVQFAGSTAGPTQVTFLAEFVILLSRHYFQASFKCTDMDRTQDFVQQFQLQHLLVMQS